MKMNKKKIYRQVRKFMILRLRQVTDVIQRDREGEALSNILE